MRGGSAVERSYSLFGLRLRSEIPLPELNEEPNDAAGDVTIKVAKLPVATSAPGLIATGDALLLTIPGVARFSISGGRRIVVDPADGVPERNVRLYLLGSAFGALLHQRGLLPLHANAVAVGGRAIAFMGESGAGKSTLAAWLHDRGYRVLADDVCVANVEPGKPVKVAPGLPRFRLWHDALERSGRDAHAYPRSYAGDTDYDKFDVPAAPERTERDWLPLDRIYLLRRGDRFSAVQLNGVEAAEAVFENTYRGAYVDVANVQQSHWRTAIELVRRVPVFRLTRVWGVDQLDSQMLCIMDHVESANAREASVG